jgi:hypothetical protein
VPALTRFADEELSESGSQRLIPRYENHPLTQASHHTSASNAAMHRAVKLIAVLLMRLSGTFFKNRYEALVAAGYFLPPG